MRILILSLAITLSSCCSTLEPVKLNLPPELVVPKIPQAQMMCLSDFAYGELVKRDKLKSARIETLKGIIKSTH